MNEAHHQQASGTNGWTVESVLVHLNQALADQKAHFRDLLDAQERKNQQQFADADKAVTAAMAAAEKAVDKAEANAEKWRSNANEWRAAMSDRERNFAPLQRLDGIDKAIDEQKASTATLRQSATEARTTLRSELMTEIHNLRESRSEGTGEKRGGMEHVLQGNWRFGVAVAVAVGLISLLIQFLHH
jgi:Spy/CpxP family protein refolding chaperone